MKDLPQFLLPKARLRRPREKAPGALTTRAIYLLLKAIVTMTQTIERVAQISTCEDCKFFNYEQGVHGWCNAFDRMARPHHQQTAICATISKPALSHQSMLPEGYYEDNGVMRWEPTHPVDLEDGSAPNWESWTDDEVSEF